MENILLKPLKKRFIPLSSDEDEDEPIYQPFKGKNNLEVPRSHFGRSISLSPIPQSPLPSPIEDSESPYLHSSPPSRNESPYLHSAPPSRDSSRISKARTKHLDWCEEEDCDICEFLINRKRSKNFFPSVDSNDSVASRGRSKSVDPKRQKPRFAKKLGQLDAAMKIVAAKVDENVWEERYLEAEELQTVMIWLRSVNRKLQKMLVLRDKHLGKYDYKAAQKAKEEYEAELKDSVDLSKIQHFLSPTEDGRTESYRAATMYRIDPVEENIPVATTTTKNEMIKESPEVIRTRCCGLCSKKTKKNSSKQNSKQSSPSLQTAVALNK